MMKSLLMICFIWRRKL